MSLVLLIFETRLFSVVGAIVCAVACLVAFTHYIRQAPFAQLWQPSVSIESNVPWGQHHT